MDSQAVLLKEQEQLFSEYPEQMDAYFTNNKVVIRIIPEEFMQEISCSLSDFQVTSANQYIQYLLAEIAFWTEKDSQNKLSSIHYKSRLVNAKNKFDTALGQYKSGNSSQGNEYLRQSISEIRAGSMNSNLPIVSFLLQYVEEDEHLIKGVRIGLLKNKNVSISSFYARSFQGMWLTLSYLEEENDIVAMELQSKSINDTVETARAQYAELNANYTNAFHEQENRLRDITNQTNEHIKMMDDEAARYYEERNKRCDDLENLYDEKLKLQAPAEYWKQQEKTYWDNGMSWFKASVIIAIVIVIGLVILLASIPNLFSNESHWLDVFKNSAIITIITSVAIYILRITVKMAMSSFHLSRDAKERHNLSYFYLALIQDKAITDKERALVINSLFSRSDTGLLKNDSGPTMSNNVMDLVEKATNS